MRVRMPDGDGAPQQSTLSAWVTAGQLGPVLVLSGEADVTCTEQLSALLTAQLSLGTQQLTVDLSRLRFADSATIRALVMTARRLGERGGNLVLLRPQQPVARVLALTGAEQLFVIRGEPRGHPDSESGEW
jgi:anti-anti-sigma factor